MKRTPLRRKSKSPTARAKDRIQKLLTKIVRVRDKGCIFEGVGRCGGVTMADHIISRKINRTYGLSGNCVEICFTHHTYWKPSNPTLYTKIVREYIGQEALDELHELEKEETHYKLADWLEIEEELKKELEKWKQS